MLSFVTLLGENGSLHLKRGSLNAQVKRGDPYQIKHPFSVTELRMGRVRNFRVPGMGCFEAYILLQRRMGVAVMYFTYTLDHVGTKETSLLPEADYFIYTSPIRRRLVHG